MLKSVAFDDLIPASFLHNRTALPERVFKQQGANVSNVCAPVIKSMSDSSTHLNFLRAFTICRPERIRNRCRLAVSDVFKDVQMDSVYSFRLAELRRIRNPFRSQRLHPWVKASACSETVAKLESCHWLFELQLWHVWQIMERGVVLWERVKCANKETHRNMISLSGTIRDVIVSCRVRFKSTSSYTSIPCSCIICFGRLSQMTSDLWIRSMCPQNLFFLKIHQGDKFRH